MTTSWLSTIPVCQPCAYKADIICEDCAQSIIIDLSVRGVEDTGDSNDYPQPSNSHNEADSPQHCGHGEKCLNAVSIPGGKKIGCPLNTSLTNDGIAYTRDKIAEQILFGTDHQKAIGRMWWSLYQDSIEKPSLIQLTKDVVKIPPPLRKALSPLLNSKSTNVLGEIFTDLEYIYGGAVWGGTRNRLTLWRVGISDTGEFTTVDQVLLPADILLGESLDVMLSDAISENAWD
jgi:hypothetical protein